LAFLVEDCSWKSSNRAWQKNSTIVFIRYLLGILTFDKFFMQAADLALQHYIDLI
jgi:hypothetical protein